MRKLVEFIDEKGRRSRGAATQAATEEGIAVGSKTGVCRTGHAARGLLGWSQGKLARAAGVGLATLQRIAIYGVERAARAGVHMACSARLRAVQLAAKNFSGGPNHRSSAQYCGKLAF
jgi:hypothetical protein